MSSSAKAAADGAMGSKAARACDGCMRRRARWYCAADDAFLCQGCDTSVHSANPLARRHERVRLRPTSPLLPKEAGASSAPREKRRGEEVVPAWIKRKARTPRSQAKSVGRLLSRRLVVPEASSGGESAEEQKCDGETDEEELLYHRVPIFDPALAELCSSPSVEETKTAVASGCDEDVAIVENTTKSTTTTPSPEPEQLFPDSLVSFGPTDAELMEFAADMEALLGRPGMDDGSEEEPFCMEALGLMDPVDVSVKLETDAMRACGLELEPEASSDMFDFDLDYGSPQVATPDENAGSSSAGADAPFFPRSLALNLNYQAIIEKWESSPFADGERPDVKLEDCWPHDYYSFQAGAWMMGGGAVGYGGEDVGTPRLRMGDGNREARVARYREKRRTRLFSKKIRYEVRKLNAEKRPRMKGRFVKRLANGAAVATACVA